MSSNLKPIIILLTGDSRSGKSTTANAIKSHQTHLIRGDGVIYSIPKWCSNKKCCSIYQRYADRCNHKDLGNHLNILSKELDNACAEKFVTQLINSEYFTTAKTTLLMEGYVFGLPNIKRELYTQLHETYYIWEMTRLQEQVLGPGT
jgi:dephospho-CoA kinase